MRVVNLFAGPGAGKSTTAAMVFSLLKQRGIESELVTEYAKILTWADRAKTLRDQLYVFAKQDHKLEILRGHPITFAVTDSPLLTSLLYAPDGYLRSFEPLVWEVFNSYDNLNFFLHRTKPYQRVGRTQTEDEARVICDRTRQMLVANHVPFVDIEADSEAARHIVAHLLGEPRIGGAVAHDALSGVALKHELHPCSEPLC